MHIKILRAIVSNTVANVKIAHIKILRAIVSKTVANVKIATIANAKVANSATVFAFQRIMILTKNVVSRNVAGI